MARVTVEGSITPSTFLARGKRMTVERTPFIDKLIRRGYLDVVDTPDATAEVEQITAPKLAAAKAERKMRTPRRKPKAPAEDMPLPFDAGGVDMSGIIVTATQPEGILMNEADPADG